MLNDCKALRQLEYESLQDVARSEQGQYVITQLKRQVSATLCFNSTIITDQNILQPLRESKPNFELLSLRMELLDETDDAEFIDELKQVSYTLSVTNSLQVSSNQNSKENSF